MNFDIFIVNEIKTGLKERLKIGNVAVFKSFKPSDRDFSFWSPVLVSETSASLSSKENYR